MASREATQAAPNNDSESAATTLAPNRRGRPPRIRQKSATPPEAKAGGDEDVPDDVESNAQQRVPSGDAAPIETAMSSDQVKESAEAKEANGRSVAVDDLPEPPKETSNPSKASTVSRSRILARPRRSVKTLTIKQPRVTSDIPIVEDFDPEESVKESAPKKQKLEPKPRTRLVTRKPRSKWDNPTEMLTNPNAPLVNAKLREILCSPKAWDILTPEETKKILAKFPDATEIINPGTPGARPDIAALLNNNNFRYDVARYQEGLGKGHHGADWIHQAQAAHRARQFGVYDEFMATEFQEKWDMAMPQPPKAESAGDEPEMQVDGVSPGSPTEDGSMESDSAVWHENAEEVPATSRGTDDRLGTQTEDIQPRSSTEDRNAPENTNSKVASTDTTSQPGAGTTFNPEHEEIDQKLENDTQPEEQVEARATTNTQDPIESGKQELEHQEQPGEPDNKVSQNAPDMMEGVEHHNPEKQAIATAAGHDKDAEKLETPHDTGMQSGVEPTQMAEDTAIADESKD
ncbi:hypothetical protein GGR50DRAFT_637836 [Xylaria sp. CBS 124048]|nr:hypothetical protein GGR50DRAFT_637836 [Xylaria sp. CBS 124048]